MSEIKIWGTSFSLIGDLIMSLPQLNYFKKKFPDSYIYFVIHRKISYCAPLFFNHPLIDKIRITDGWSDFGPNDYLIAKECNILTTEIDHKKNMIKNRVPVDSENWWNKRSCIEQCALMSNIHDLNDYIDPRELYPMLFQWFDSGFEIAQKKAAYTYKKIDNKENRKLNKSISIWPFAAYGRSKTRSPSVSWWNKFIDVMSMKKINVVHCGYVTEPDLSANSNYYKKITHLDFLDQIKISLGTNISVGTDSGSMWVLGAYSHPSVNLITNWANNHSENLHAFAPKNINGVNLFSQDGCDNIDVEQVTEIIDKSLYEISSNFNKIIKSII